MHGDQLKQLWYSVRLQARWLEARGSEFQQLFADILRRSRPDDFQAVRPHGAAGDLGCDGRLLSNDTMFACYGPEGNRPSVGAAKLKADFTRCRRLWPNMKEWILVHNWRTGLPGPLVRALDELRQQHPEVRIPPAWDFLSLRAELDGLTDRDLEELLGPYPADLAQHYTHVSSTLAGISDAIEQLPVRGLCADPQARHLALAMAARLLGDRERFDQESEQLRQATADDAFEALLTSVCFCVAALQMVLSMSDLDDYTVRFILESGEVPTHHLSEESPTSRGWRLVLNLLQGGDPRIDEVLGADVLLLSEASVAMAHVALGAVRVYARRTRLTDLEALLGLLRRLQDEHSPG
jgi:hypothetical protein